MVKTKKELGRGYVFGADGMLGHALVAELTRVGLEPVPVGRHVDITSEEAVRTALADFTWRDFIINAAAMTHVDACEHDPEKAFAVNAWGARTLARWRWGQFWQTFVQISTGAVFDGLEAQGWRREGHDEFVPPRPLSVYARSKWSGEELVRTSRPADGLHHSAIIVRLGHLYGPRGKNSLSTARAKLLRGETLPLNADSLIVPTYVRDAARVIVEAAQRVQGSATLHVSPEGSTTASLFGEHLAARVGVPTDRVTRSRLHYPNGPGTLGASLPVSDPNADLNSRTPYNLAWRPRFQLIRSSVLRHHGIAPIGPWEEGLDRYLKDEASS